MARQDFLDAEEIISRLNTAFITHKKVIEDSASAAKTYQEQFNKLPSGYIKAQKEILDLTYKQARADKELANAEISKAKVLDAQYAANIKLNREKQSAIRLSETQQRQLDKETKAQARANAELEKANNLYNKVQQKVNALTSVYNNLATKKELGLKLSDRENAQLISLEGRLNKYQKVLKNVDANIGKHGRNVGYYASAYNGLSTSINQITRELPAFSVSLNTGFLAISNNIPMLIDEIERLKIKNRELISQGQPVKSIFTQLATSVFSFQTLLSVGITLLTVYGGKLIEWATSAKTATRQMDLLSDANDRYNNTLVETGTKSEVELTNLKRKLAVAKDETKSMEERTHAAKSLIDQYPGYFKGLSKESIMLSENKQNTQEYIKAVRQLTSDIQARVDAESKQSQSRENLKIAYELEQEAKIRQDINDKAKEYYDKYGENSNAAKFEVDKIRERIKARKELLDEDKEFISKFGKVGVAATGSVNLLGLYEPAQITDLKLRAQELRDVVESEQEEINKIFQKTSLLDLKTDKETKEKKVELLKDVAATQYALNQAKLQNEAEYNKKIFENDENGFADREHSAKRYGEIILEMAQNTREEDLRLLKESTNNEIKELKNRASQGEITQSNANAVIKSIEQQSAYDRQLIYENYSKAVIDANAEIESSLKGVWSGLKEQEQQIKLLDQQILNLRQTGNIFENVDGNTTVKQFAEIENKLRDIQNQESDMQISGLRFQRESLSIEIERLSKLEKNQQNNAAINKALIEQKNIDKQILDLENKRKQAIADVYQQMRMATDQYLKSVSTSALSDLGFSSLSPLFEQTTYEVINSLGEIETKTGSTFQKMFDQAQGLGEKFAVVFTSVTSVAQEAFAFITQASAASFQAQYDDLEKRQELALKYAGQSQEAQDKINQQYEERRKDIRNRELKAQKEAALFNAFINVAQGITAALATGPSGIPLAAVIAALGAIQISFIAGQDIPAYAEGTMSHTGGAMLVNDAPGSSYKEIVKTPDGKVYKPQRRNTVMNAPKGTKVFKNQSEYDKFNSDFMSMLNTNDISPFSSVLNRHTLQGTVINNNSINKDDLLWALDTSLSKVGIVNATFDANGISVWGGKQHAKTTSLNNLRNSKGFIA